MLEYICTITSLQLGSLSHFQNILSSLLFLSVFFFHWFLLAADFVAGHEVQLVSVLLIYGVFFLCVAPTSGQMINEIRSHIITSLWYWHLTAAV